MRYSILIREIEMERKQDNSTFIRLTVISKLNRVKWSERFGDI